MNVDKKIYKSIGIGFLVKPLNILITFLITPIYINYLGDSLYGIWVTILSILSWISICDVGLGNGLKVHLTDALTKNNYKKAREYISTTYAIIVSITMLIFSLSFLGFRYFNWNKIFNSNMIDNLEFNTLMMVSLGLVLVNFILITINQINYSMHESFKIEIRNLISQVLNLLILLLLLNSKIKKNILIVSIAYNCSSILINLFSTFLIFKKNKNLIPKINFIKMNKVKKLLNLSTQFFIIQIMAIIIFTTDNIIIANIFGPEKVTNYSIVLKVFSICLVFHQIILMPLVPGYTKAFVEKDMIWIKKTLKKLFVLEFFLILGVVLLGLLFGFITKIWLGYRLDVPNSLILNFGIFVILSTYSNIHAQFYSGLGKLKFQLVIAIFQGGINIPLSIFLAKNLNFGVTGIILGTNITMLLGAIPFTFYTNKIIKQNRG